MSTVPQIFDRRLLKQRLARAALRGPATFLLERAADDLAERLATIKRAFPTVLDYGTPGPDAAAVMMQHEGTERVAGLGVLEEDAADLENPNLGAESYDAIVSLLALQFINDLPGVLAQMRRALKPDGLLLAAMIGGETLHELRSILIDAEMETTGRVSPRIAPFADVRSLGQLLQRAGFALPVADSETLTVRYASAIDLMVDVRDMGAANILFERSRTPMTRTTLLRAAELYAERFADADGRIRATFEIIWLSGWAPHESQQKPLRPGSARVSLSSVLPAPGYGKTPT